ncbi:DUF4352 domain-containing protein [Mycetocola tolaasinivorans]|uniref:DUF4352 domain-containing protein n=2 Tax=Mycetocola tolaasinivorans TaxID=76635 RepID=A0A3L7A5A8_9MICO|nr:DUF4352 domain-containing protein [Mycetocola tolaasinivorans]
MPFIVGQGSRAPRPPSGGSEYRGESPQTAGDIGPFGGSARVPRTGYLGLGSIRGPATRSNSGAPDSKDTATMSTPQNPIYAPEPQHQALPPVKKRSWFARHKVLTVLGIVGAIIVVASVAAGGGSKGDGVVAVKTPAAGEPAAQESGAEEPAKEEPAKEAPGKDLPAIGTPVTAGSMEFTVTGVEEAGASVGGQYLSATAQGRFVRVALSVKNVGNNPETFLVNYLKVEDSQGRSFNADSSATIYDTASADTWISEINPGNAVTGSVIFDLPADAELATLTVSNSVWGSGKKIALN